MWMPFSLPHKIDIISENITSSPLNNMSEIKPREIAFGTIFPYAEAVEESEIESWLEDEGFDIVDGKSQGISIGDAQISLGGPSPFAQKDGIQVLIDLDAEIEGFADASFVTFKAGEQAKFDAVLDYVDQFWTEYHEFDVESEAALVEMNYNGRVQIDRGENEFTNYFDSEPLTELDQLAEGGARGTAARFESDLNKTTSGWFRLLLDSQQARNPRYWAYRLTQRFEDYTEIDGETLQEAITDFVDASNRE